jgi:hypothetical protein
MLVALLLSAGLVVADDATPAASTTQTATAVAKPQKICKSIKTLGSRLPVKKCQTVEEAADEEAQAQQAVRDMQRNAPPPNQ